MREVLGLKRKRSGLLHVVLALAYALCFWRRFARSEGHEASAQETLSCAFLQSLYKGLKAFKRLLKGK